MPGKRRKIAAAGNGDAAGDAASQEWKSVEMGFDLMAEFEKEGGVFVEEADQDMDIQYYDGLNSRKTKQNFKKDATKNATVAAQIQVGDSKRHAAPATTKKQKGKNKQKKVENQKAKDRPVRVEAVGEKEGEDEDKEEEGGTLNGSGDEQKDRTKLANDATVPGDPTPTGVDSSEGGIAEEDDAAPEMEAWRRFDLHPLLMKGLKRLGFLKPTPVQDKCLMPAVMYRKDIVGAAETGSGKTLAFGLPILHHTLLALGDQAGKRPCKHVERELRALIVLPTRELAVQVHNHINALDVAIPVSCVVGGMSLQKQTRLLKRQPQLLIGTPGRLGALLGVGKDAEKQRCDWLVRSLRTIRHLVLDEADRLVESGHFRELDQILSRVYEALERQNQLQTFIFSATLTLDPRRERKKDQGTDDGGKIVALMKRLRFREARAVHLVDLTQDADDLNETAHHDTASTTIEAAPTPARTSSLRSQLPAQLKLREAFCSNEKERETLLTMWMLRRYRWGDQQEEAARTAQSLGQQTPATPKRSAGGRVVVFVNAVSSVNRLASVMAMVLEAPEAQQVLARVKMNQISGGQGKPATVVHVMGLHSHMQQKDRLKRVERFRSLQHGVLVCTDIAARGLDIPELAAVVHYHCPRSTEVFVHRSGRTARAGRPGESIALMIPGDAGHWGKVYGAAGIKKDSLQDINPTAFEVQAAREACRLAVELEGKVHQTAKKQFEDGWRKRTADELEIMLSDSDHDPEEVRPKAPKKQLAGLYHQLLARVRRPPKRLGGGPLARWGGGQRKRGKRR